MKQKKFLKSNKYIYFFDFLKFILNLNFLKKDLDFFWIKTKSLSISSTPRAAISVLALLLLSILLSEGLSISIASSTLSRLSGASDNSAVSLSASSNCTVFSFKVCVNFNSPNFSQIISKSLFSHSKDKS
eukprot:NODE_17_length_41373_cov_0.337016.p27 type:complete len:130 gc:universal NODE_17_length_41373_cov_0.337016:35484-35873(+)